MRRAAKLNEDTRALGCVLLRMAAADASLRIHPAEKVNAAAKKFWQSVQAYASEQYDAMAAEHPELVDGLQRIIDKGMPGQSFHRALDRALEPGAAIQVLSAHDLQKLQELRCASKCSSRRSNPCAVCIQLAFPYQPYLLQAETWASRGRAQPQPGQRKQRQHKCAGPAAPGGGAETARAGAAAAGHG